jgi:pimeloyl-ACP methyl ester carboxylesterase
MTVPRVLISGGAVDPARLYARLLQQLPPAPTGLLAMPQPPPGTDLPAARDLCSRRPREGARRNGLELEEQAVARAVQRLGDHASQVDLVAFSGGATSALAYLTAHPDRVRCVVLVEPSWLGNDPASPEEARYLEELDAVMRLADADLVPAFLRHFSPYRDPSAPPPIPAAVLAVAAPGMRRLWQSWRGAPAQPDLTGLAGRLLVVAGGRSHPRMVTAAHHLAERVPQGRAHISAPHDHFTVTAAATQPVVAFIAGAAATAPAAPARPVTRA